MTSKIYYDNVKVVFKSEFGCGGGMEKSKKMTGSFPVPPFKIPSFMFVLRVITAKCVMLRCKV